VRLSSFVFQSIDLTCLSDLRSGRVAKCHKHRERRSSNTIAFSTSQFLFEPYFKHQAISPVSFRHILSTIPPTSSNTMPRLPASNTVKAESKEISEESDIPEDVKIPTTPPPSNKRKANADAAGTPSPTKKASGGWSSQNKQKLATYSKHPCMIA
jgi:hypothetical protein